MRSIFRQCLREVADDLTFQLEPPAPPEVVEAGQENWIPDEQALSKRKNSCQVLWRELLPSQELEQRCVVIDFYSDPSLTSDGYEAKLAGEVFRRFISGWLQTGVDRRRIKGV